MTHKERKARAKSPWVRTCDLFRGGVFVGKVVSFDRTRDRANVYLHYAGRDCPGRESGWIPVAQFTGRRRTGPHPREMSEDEVRAELVSMCAPKSVFGTAPAPAAVVTEATT